MGTPGGVPRPLVAAAPWYTRAGIFVKDIWHELAFRFFWWWWLDVDMVLLNAGGLSVPCGWWLRDSDSSCDGGTYCSKTMRTRRLGRVDKEFWAARGVDLLVWTPNSLAERRRLTKEGVIFLTDTTDPEAECPAQSC